MKFFFAKIPEFVSYEFLNKIMQKFLIYFFFKRNIWEVNFKDNFWLKSSSEKFSMIF